MNPSIWIYGGVHNDPGSRQRFLEELTQQETAPRFIAVEWEKSVFERLAAWRPWVEEGLRSRCGFLTPKDCHELSLALGWEGDSYAALFPGTDPLWLESGFQEADLRRRDSDAYEFAKNSAWALLQRLSNACRPPLESQGKMNLIDRVSRDMWSEASSSTPNPADFERDTRWVTRICERISDVRDGWIAVVVGWAHADPTTGNQRLGGYLLSRGFCVNSVCLHADGQNFTRGS